MTNQVKEALEHLKDSGCSEAIAVAECLDSIASNGKDSANTKFLVGCANEIKSWCDEFIHLALQKSK